jgi:hypothetical protein
MPAFLEDHFNWREQKHRGKLHSAMPAVKLWLLIILATWEAEIGRIVAPGQPGQKVLETPPHLNKWLGTVA